MTRAFALPPIIKIHSSLGNRAIYRRLGASSFNLPQIVIWLLAGDTASAAPASQSGE